MHPNASDHDHQHSFFNKVSVPLGSYALLHAKHRRKIKHPNILLVYIAHANLLYRAWTSCRRRRQANKWITSGHYSRSESFSVQSTHMVYKEGCHTTTYHCVVPPASVKWKESYQASHERQIRRGAAAGTKRKRYGLSGRAWSIWPHSE